MAPPFNTSQLAEESRYILVNGDRVEVAEDADILAVLRAETQRRGITTFAAYVSGRELNSLDEISSEFDAGKVLEVRTYAKPGLSL